VTVNLITPCEIICSISVIKTVGDREMMGQQAGVQERLFYEFRLDDWVPTDHLLRKIDGILDMTGLRRHLGGIVSLATRAEPWQPSGHDDFIKPVSRLPVPARGHRARGLALSLLQPEPARR
jgi:hypothetical protein